MQRIYKDIKCGKCGAVVSGVYCPMCGARLRNTNEAIYNRLTRDGNKWGREKEDFCIGIHCINIAKEIQDRKYPGQFLKNICTEKDVQEIMARAERLYKLLSKAIVTESETAQN